MRARLLYALLRETRLGELTRATPPLAELTVQHPGVAADAPVFSSHADFLRTAPSASNRVVKLLPRAYFDGRCNVVLPRRGRIVLESENVWREFPGRPFHSRYYWRYHYTLPSRKLDGLCMALRSPANNYYHTLIDNLPRLYWLTQPALRDQHVRVLVSGPLRPWEAYFLPQVMPDNAELCVVEPQYLWRAEQMVMGEYLSEPMSGALPQHYLDYFLPRVLPARPRQRRHRIYISRRQAPGGRRILNEEAVRACVEAQGFTVYLLETLAISEQIALFYDAEIVVAPHGAGITNILFAAAITLVELHPTRAIMPHYYFMARAMGHAYHVLCADETDRHSSFSVDVAALTHLLQQFSNDEDDARAYEPA
jgi:capsular polysaccharide biosynthesis protein